MADSLPMPHDRNTVHSAPASALGYIYQCRLALVHALRKLATGRSFTLSIETLDDVVFDNDGDAVELLQAKHHIGSAANLTDSSPELWSALRIWCETLTAGTLPEDAMVYLLTTSSAPDGSAASYLGATSRDESAALRRLSAASTTSTNQTNTAAYAAFRSLTEQQRKDLIKRATVFASAATIEGLDDELRQILFFAVAREHLDAFLQRLEGWWFRRVILHLSRNGDQIHGDELESQQAELREQFKRDQLPIDSDIMTASIDASGYQDTIFVHQMRLIEISSRRIVLAIQDYFRAFEQRSRWMREELLLVGELDQYESRLIDEWERLFEQMRDELGDDAADDAKRAAAQSIFKWVENGMHPPIRGGMQEPTIARGSYQMLADDQRVGWHLDFRDRLAVLLTSAEKES